MKKKLEKNHPKKRTIKAKPGDLIAIPLGNGVCAYGLVYENIGIGLFKTSNGLTALADRSMSNSFMLHGHFIETPVESGEWPIIGHIEFRNKAAAWPAPMWHLDELSGRYEIRHMGRSRPATKAQIRGLDRSTIWFPQGLVDEIKRRLD